MNTETDPRLLSLGREIPGLHYCDQPYIVIADDGAWVCAMTTSAGHEGETDQHVRVTRSLDNGKTWSEPARMEDPDQPENSYSVLLKTNFGRIYCCYNFNAENVREAATDDGRMFKRVDSLGHYVMRYSDNHGKTWSAERIEIPVREFQCDRDNVYGGKIRYFWNVGRPLISQNKRDVWLSLHKIGSIGHGFQTRSEGVFIHSDNMLDEPDISKINFETLPDGDVGLRLPGNEEGVAEEQSVTELSDGSLFCVYRTKTGWPACAYSRDRGHTWSDPQFMTYRPGGRRVKHPRAANFVWRCSNGKFLYWFHNHGGEPITECPGHSLNGWVYQGRNPAWLSCGVERDTPEGKIIEWSEPEIALYDDDPMVRMSYPDLIEEDGRFFLSQTQKTQGRVNEVSPRIIDALFNQFDLYTASTEGLVLNWRKDKPTTSSTKVEIGELPFFHDRNSEDMSLRPLNTGVTIDLRLKLDDLTPGQVIVSNMTKFGHGWRITTTIDGTLELLMCDSNQKCVWDCDPGLLQPGKTHHVTIIIDARPRIISFVVDGKLCDGGETREFGWAFFSPTIRTMKGGDVVELHHAVEMLRVYDRPLLTGDAVAGWRSENSA